MILDLHDRPKLPNNASSKVANEDALVQVRQVPRKGMGLSKRHQTERLTHNNEQLVKPKNVPQDAIYEGTSNSPHIKPEYLNARQQNSAIIIQSDSVGSKDIPLVRGMQVVLQESSEEWRIQKLPLDKSKLTSHPFYQHQLGRSSPVNRQQFNEMNKDLAVTSDQLGQLSVAQSRKIAQARRAMKNVETLAVADDSIASQHQHNIKVSMPGDQRSFIETEASGGSAIRLATDAGAPTRNLLQHSNVTASTDQQLANSNRDKMKKKSEKMQGKQPSHVQLTEYLANHKMQQQLQQIQMAEQQIEGNAQISQQVEVTSFQNSQDYLSMQSQEGMLTGKVTDFNVAQTQILLPKLQAQNGQSMPNVVTNRVQELGSDELAFVNMVNSNTKSDMQIQSEAHSPNNLSSQNLKHKQPFGGSRPGKILIQKSGHIRPNRIIRINPVEPSQPMLEDDVDFQIVAERKQVVANMWAEQQNWQRKRNAMSYNEIKRQQNLLNNLPMISKQNTSINKSSKPTSPVSVTAIASKSIEVIEYHQIAEGIKQVNISSNTTPATLLQLNSATQESNSIGGPDADLREMDQGTNLIHNRLSMNGEVQTLTQQDKRDSPIVQLEPPHQIVNSSRRATMPHAQQHFIKELQSNREEMGITTAHFDSRNTSQDTCDHVDRSGKLMKKVAQWGQKMIQIGSRFMPDPRRTSQDWAKGRRLNTSHEGTHILTSLDGSVIIRPDRFDRRSLEIRNASQGRDSQMIIKKYRQQQRPQQANPWASVRDSKPIICGESSMAGTRKFDFRSMNKTHYQTHNTNCRGTTVHQAKRVQRSRQRQISDMFNLGALRSERIQNIKVSRLNELGAKQDGNPIDQLNKQQQELDQRTQILLTGGDHTKHLQSLNTQVKYQADAIADFTCRESRFNQTEGFDRKKGDNSLMSLKKLIGRQAILLPDKYKSKYDLLEQQSKSKVIHVDKDDNSSRSATSRESFDHRIQSNIMRKIVNDDNVQSHLHQSDLVQFSPRETITEVSQMKAIQPGSEPITSPNNQESEKPDPKLKVVLSEKGTLMDETSQNQGGSFMKETRLLSPLCSKIKLVPNEKISAQKRMLDDLALKSREMVKKNRSRTQNIKSDRPDYDHKSDERVQSTFRDSANKDMQDMLNTDQVETQYARNPDDDSMKIDVSEQTPLLKPSQDKAVMFSGFHIRQQTYHRLPNDRIDSSDAEDQISQNLMHQLNPMGIDEEPENEYSDRRNKVISSKVPPSREKSKQHSMKVSSLQASSDDMNAKCQIYAVLEDSQLRKRLDGVSSDPTFEKATMIQNDTQKPNSQEDYAIDQNMQAPVISVTSVKIQKAKPFFQKGEDMPPSSRQKHLKASIVGHQGGEGTSLIKHDDQSLKPEINSGTETVVRQSFKLSSAGSSKKENGLLVSSQNFREIVSTQTDGISNEEQRVFPVETLQHTLINLDSDSRIKEISPAVTLEKEQPPQLSGEKATGTSNHDQSMCMKRQSIGSKCSSDYPAMLNLLSKKQEVQSPKNRRSLDKNSFQGRLGQVTTPDRRNSGITLQSDILEQLNAVNSMMAPHLANGYHQLEPKLFSTNMAQILHQQSPVSIEAPQNNTGGILSARTNMPAPATKTNILTSKTCTTEEASQVDEHQNQQAFEASESLDELGFVSHAAIENHLHTNRQVKQQMEQRKREYVKWTRDQAAVVGKESHGVSILSSQQQFCSNERSILMSSAQEAANNRFKNGTELSFRPDSVAGSDMEYIANRDQQWDSQNIELRNMRKVEKDMPKCINIEKLMKKSIKEAYNTLEELVGRCPKHCARECTHDKDKEDENKKSPTSYSIFSFRPKRKGLMNLDTMIVADLYKDHLKYEFKENELYSLLGEATESNRSEITNKRRYFLKFSSLQIINVDCQSGIMYDIEPISLPVSRMIQLFFLSVDQLQQVLCECLRLRREGMQLKLFLDQDLLRQKIYRAVPRVIREDYYSAPLQISLLETIEGNSMVKDSFNLEVRLPRIEIVTTSDETNRECPQEPLYKTTMTHNLTGEQMMTILQKYNLLDWADYAKKLISERTFGVDSLQADGDASVIKFQRLDYKGDFVLYKDPRQLAQEESIAKSLQLTMIMSVDLRMQIEFFRPLYIKLKVNKREPEPDIDYKPLPGYLPDSTKVKKAVSNSKTVAFMQLHYAKLPFIKQVFGDKIHQGDGCFLECLYDMVELQMDSKRDILRMAIPSWRRLEEINIRQMSQKYFAQQQLQSQTQQETRKYLPQSKEAGKVKAMLHSKHDFTATAVHSQSVAASCSQDFAQLKDYASMSQHQMQASSQEMSVLRKPNVRMSNTNVIKPSELLATSTLLALPKNNITDSQQDLLQYKTKKRLQVNELQCKLKISSLTKAVYVQEINSSDLQEAHKKVTLAEFLGPQQQELMK